MKLLVSLVIGSCLILQAVDASPTDSVTASDPQIVRRDGATYHNYEHKATGSSMAYIENSGICETTPGVNQYSGYFSVGQNMNMWFWFFESRQHAATAPLAIWLNGGPGCSSMIGLFQEHGPCHFVGNSTTPSLNPYSWNSVSNMLYVDQPIGTGFSYGRDPVTSTVAAGPYVWAFLQAFFDQFPQYETRDFGLFTESYGGHYGPEFADYFMDQNTAIDNGTVKGQKLNLVALGINNGWFDSAIQAKSYIDYAAINPYRPLITPTQRISLLESYYEKCLPSLQQCTAPIGKDGQCAFADNTCNEIYDKIAGATDFNVYDVRAPRNDSNPPENYVAFLNDTTVKRKIGAQSQYQECADTPYDKFMLTGDNARSFQTKLAKVVESGIQVLIWAGDADWICNYLGNYKVLQALQWSQGTAFASKPLASYTVSGKAKGKFKTLGSLSWLQVFQAGHEVPFYQPEVSLQAFNQTMQKQPLHAT